MWEFTRTKFWYVVPFPQLHKNLWFLNAWKISDTCQRGGADQKKDKVFFESKEAICVFFVFLCGGGWGFKIGIPARKQKKRDESDCYHKNRKDAVPWANSQIRSVFGAQNCDFRGLRLRWAFGETLRSFRAISTCQPWRKATCCSLY